MISYNRKKRLLKKVKNLRVSNVSKACRMAGISRSQYYVYKRRYAQHGFAGLKHLKRTPKNIHWATPDKVQKIIVQTTIDNPFFGCDRLKNIINDKDISISATTIQKILKKHNLDTLSNRSAHLENLLINKNVELSDEQLFFVEKHNPWLKDKNIQCAYPGQVLIQNTIYLGKTDEGRKNYYHILLDAYSLYTIGVLSTVKNPSTTFELYLKANDYFYGMSFNNRVLITNTGAEFAYSKNKYNYKYFSDNDIELKQFRFNRKNTPGVYIYFRDLFNRQFIREMKINEYNQSDVKLDRNLDIWKKNYNRNCKILGYRNFGKTPIQMIKSNCLKR